MKRHAEELGSKPVISQSDGNEQCRDDGDGDEKSLRRPLEYNASFLFVARMQPPNFEYREPYERKYGGKLNVCDDLSTRQTPIQ